MKEELEAILSDLKNLTPVTQVLSLVERLEAVVAGFSKPSVEPTPVETPVEVVSTPEVSPATEVVGETPVTESTVSGSEVTDSTVEQA